MNIYRFPVKFDMTDFKREIEAFPAAWYFDTSRSNAFYEHRDTESISLRHGKAKMGEMFRNIHETFDTILYPHFPSAKKFMDHFIEKYGGECGRIAIVKLHPEKEVVPHIDEGDYYRARDRFHLVISGMYQYTVAGETDVFTEGDLFWFDSQKIHQAKSISNQGRISMIFDIKDCKFRDHVG